MLLVIGVIVAIVLILAAGIYFAMSTAAAKKAEQDAIIAQQKFEESQRALLAAQQQQQAAAAAALEAQQKLEAQRLAEQKMAEQRLADQQAAEAAAQQAAAAAAAASKPVVNPYANPHSCAFQKDGVLYKPTFTSSGITVVNEYQNSPNAGTCAALNVGCPDKNCFIWQNKSPPGGLLPPTEEVQLAINAATCVIL